MIRTFQNALWQTQTLPKGTDRKARSETRGRPPTLLTEQQVLEARARHEFFGWPYWQCAKLYGTSKQYMRNLMAYQVRGHLIPTPADANLSH